MVSPEEGEMNTSTNSPILVQPVAIALVPPADPPKGVVEVDDSVDGLARLFGLQQPRLRHEVWPLAET
jgi:hypothetical protein